MQDRGSWIGVVRGPSGEAVQDLFRQVIGRWQPVLRVAGVIAESHGLADRHCSAGYLRSIGNGQRFAIFADRGAGSTVCQLDGDGALMAAAAVEGDIAAGCDLVLLSKFGRLEAAGKGLRRAFDAALAAHLPVLTTVSVAVMEKWERFAGPGFRVLSADGADVDGWIEASRSRLR